MIHTVSKCTPNCRSGPSLPPHLSYWSDNTPSGWWSFPVNIFPERHRPSDPFLHLRYPTSCMLPSHISSVAVSIPVFPYLRHPSCPPLSSPLTLSAIPIILRLHRASIFILLRLCCGPYRVIFHRSVYFAAVVCLPSPIGYSTHSASFCTTLLAPLFSTLIFSLSALIFSPQFYFLFWHVSYLSPWYFRSAPICRIFIHLPSLRSAPIWSYPSALSTTIFFLNIWYAQLWLILSWSYLLAPICFDLLSQIWSIFRSSGPSNFS